MPSRKRDLGELSPAAKYYFMTGLHAQNHYCGSDGHGWRCELDTSLPPCTGRDPVPGGMALLFMADEDRDSLWNAHRASLVAEARPFGFAPAGPDGEPVDLEATAEWRRAFMAPYGRRADHVTTFDS